MNLANGGCNLPSLTIKKPSTIFTYLPHIHHIFILTSYIYMFVCVCVCIRRTVFVHLVCLFQKHLPFLCPYICSWAHIHPHHLKPFSSNTVLEPTHNLELLHLPQRIGNSGPMCCLAVDQTPRFCFLSCCTATSSISLFSLSVYIYNRN